MKRPLSHIPTKETEIFLSFDDGPDSDFTPKVLDCLSAFDAKATFFVIAEKAKQNPSELERIREKGHSIGDHSLNHQYSHFFRSQDRLKEWILEGNKTLTHLLGESPVAFRSPAGVVTPPLMRVMSELSLPWVHWNKRFFDTNLPFSWTQSFYNFQSGDIVLLHDRQKTAFQKGFLKGLEQFLARGSEKGFTFSAITKERISNV